jgi:lysophospholipase L1-like esterase
MSREENIMAKNDWHPNEKGHRIIANEFLKKYKEVYY